MYQYFAKEKYPKSPGKYILYENVIELHKDLWTAFSGKWTTIEKAQRWYDKQGQFFINRGIELMLFFRDEEGCYLPAKINNKIAV